MSYPILRLAALSAIALGIVAATFAPTPVLAHEAVPAVMALR